MVLQGVAEAQRKSAEKIIEKTKDPEASFLKLE
jgi:hypothetical protein